MRDDSGQGSEHLYLLAGTPTIHDTSGFPVRLYTASNGRLALVRKISSNLFSVADDLDGHFYVLGIDLRTLNVIHEDAPRDVDVVMSPNGDIRSGILPFSAFYYPTWGAIGDPGVPPGVIYAGGTSTSTWRVGRVFADTAPGHARVTAGNWDLYRDFRYAGNGGGPYRSVGVGAVIVDSTLVVKRGGNHVSGQGVLGPAPSFLPAEAGAHTVNYEDSTGEHSATFRGAGIVADTPDFFAFDAPVAAGGTRWPRTIYVLNKRTNSWSVVKAPFSYLGPRLFGPWLASTVQEPNSTGRENPGLGNERANEVDRRTPLGLVRELPRVRGMYPDNIFMPGRLTLQNLFDQRKVAIQTGQQDSEILDVRSDGLVLYRVNDSIFEAKIEGDKLSPPTLVVKDDDVPEVHWAFWSNAQVKGKAKPKTTLLATPIGNR